MKISLNWLQTYFKEPLPPVDKLVDDFTFHLCEVEGVENVGGDTILDVNILPNRAHDCLCHRGIAKEVGAFYGWNIVDPEVTPIKGDPTSLQVSVESPKCRRYMARIIRNVSVKESPDFLKDKLASIGQRSINNLVDVGNFVLFDKGQPVHVFDADKLTNQGITIREGINGESLTTLDGKAVSIDSSMLVIADSEHPLALAGIKGGTRAEVDGNTKNIIVEVANFEPVSTRKTARKLGLLTDAAKRFENDLSPELCSEALNTLTKLIVDTASTPSTLVEAVVDVYPKRDKAHSIEVTTHFINQKLGSTFSTEDIEGVWKRLDFVYEKDSDTFVVHVPTLRLDLAGVHDLVEEVGRIIGYDRVVGVLPKIQFVPKINKIFYKMLAARKLLLDRGYNEVMTYTLSKKGEREIARGPKGKSFLRTNLSEGIRESIKLNSQNAPLLKLKEVKVFEIGTVFLKDSEVIHVAYGTQKEITEVSLEDFCTKEGIGLGADYSSLVSPVTSTKFTPWSVYPFIVRDISIWMNEKYDEESVRSAIEKELPPDLFALPVHVVDTFEKDGKTSKTFRIIFQSSLKTLTDLELEGQISAVNNKIANLGLEIR